MTTTRRNLLIASASMGLIEKTFASTAIQIQQSFKNNVVFLLSNIGQCTHPAESYNDGYRWFLTDNAQTLFAPYGQVDYVYPNKFSLTVQADADIGNIGQCVGFVKAVTTPLFSTEHWKGESTYIISNIDQLPLWSIIGVFGDNNHPNATWYDQRWVGNEGHAAIYLGKLPNNSGILVLDQNHDNKKTLAIHTIPWYSSSNIRSLSAANYRVIGYGPIFISRETR